MQNYAFHETNIHFSSVWIKVEKKFIKALKMNGQLQNNVSQRTAEQTVGWLKYNIAKFCIPRNKIYIFHKRLNKNKKEIYKSTDNKWTSVE